MSKKTLKNEKVKIKSAPKQFIVYSLSFIVLIIAIFGFSFLATSSKEPRNTSDHTTCLQIEQECFELEIMDSNQERLKGLSERLSLPEGQGMLFVFEEIEEQCFWMKDMLFNIDIVWLDESKTIRKIERNISPDTYPELFCGDNAKYVLEFNEGFVERYGLKPGTTLQF